MNLKVQSNGVIKSDALTRPSLDEEPSVALYLQLREDMASWAAKNPTPPSALADYLNGKRKNEPLFILVNPTSARVQADTDGQVPPSAFNQVTDFLRQTPTVTLVVDTPKPLKTKADPVQQLGQAVNTKQPIIPADAVPISGDQPLLINTIDNYISACVATAHRTGKPAYMRLMTGFALVAQPTKNPQEEIRRLKQIHTDAAKGVDFRATGFPQNVSVPVNEYLTHVEARRTQIKSQLLDASVQPFSPTTIFAHVETKMRERSGGPQTAEQHLLRVLETLLFPELAAVLPELKNHDTIALGPDAFVFCDFKAVTDTLKKKLSAAGLNLL